MHNDLTASQTLWESHLRDASRMLAHCIEKARAGQPTGSPSGLAWRVGLNKVHRPWCKDEIAEMRLMRKQGFTISEIAEALDRTNESIKDGIKRHIRGYTWDGRKLPEPAE